MLEWFRGIKSEEVKVEETKPSPRKSIFSTHADENLDTIKTTVGDLLADIQSKQPIFNPAINPRMANVGMDDSSDGYPEFKMYDAGNNSVSNAVVFWYASQGFIGAQMCGIVAQNWLVNKACAMPADDAIRKGYNIVSIDGEGLEPDAVKLMKSYDRSMKLEWNMREFIRKGRIFGIRIAMFKVESTDKEYYEKPFNIDGITPNSYKGIVQVDPYWTAPMLDGPSASQPDTLHFYEPTWWIINGKKVHRSHLIIFRHAEPVDVLKPQYLYGGVPLTQQIMERIYAAERTSNEAPQLAMSKRTTVWLTDMEAVMADTSSAISRIQQWAQYRDNYGVKLGDKEGDEFQQFDTSLADFDALIMTQYQLVAAIAGVPATKLIGTSPKGFGASGDYEEASYHELLESIQTHDLTPFAERHHQLVIKSFVEPQLGIKISAETTLNWLPLDTPTAQELAATNLAKAQTGQTLISSGAVSSEEERQRVATDKTGGYNEIGLEENEAPEVEEEAENDDENETDHLGAKDAMDDSWITVHPHKGKGSPVLIGENGEIKAGMGGKFTGLNIKEVEKQSDTNKVTHGSLITKSLSEAKKDFKYSENKRVIEYNEKHKRPADKETVKEFIEPIVKHKTNKADMFSSESSTGETTYEFKPNGDFHDETHQKSAEHYMDNLYAELKSKGYKPKELVNGYSFEKNNHQVQMIHNLNDIDFHDEETPVEIKVTTHHKENDAMDAEHWITLNGKKKGEKEGGAGSHVLINGEGEVIGGAGGKLNGKTLTNVKSKSGAVKGKTTEGGKTETKPTETIKPTETEKPKEETLEEKWKRQKVEASEKADKESETAKTLEEHMSARNAHVLAANGLNKRIESEKWEHHFNKVKEHELAIKKLKSEATKEARKEAKSSPEGQGKAKIESTFVKSSSNDINKHLTENFGLKLENGVDVKQNELKAREKLNEALKFEKEGNLTKGDELRKEYWDLRKSNNTNLGRKQIDINSNSASAKGLKKVLGHVNSALENLTSQGYNIKEALNNANVSFAACPVKAKSNGTAWQLPNGAGIFTVKPLTIELETEYKKRAIARKEAGKPAWTVGGTEESSYRSTVVHEMAHALGMQKHIESPKKLGQLLIRLRSEGKLKGLNTTGNDLDNMRIWITNNISEYGSTNIKETDAELAALITSPNYTRGTLPVELENHIDELFKRNK